MNHFIVFDTCLGWMGVVKSSVGLKSIILSEASREGVLAKLKNEYNLIEDQDSTDLRDLSQRLRSYLVGESVEFIDKLDFRGVTYFQRRVLQMTQNIPYGETRSYSWVAVQLGSSRAARAVGQALARNPLPIVVPCHRVVNCNGGLGGFTCGLNVKQYLLGLESN